MSTTAPPGLCPALRQHLHSGRQATQQAHLGHAVTGKATAAASDVDQREPYSSARGRALATIEVAMLYTPANARGAQVIDMDTLKPMDRVLEVNTRAGWVKVVPDPSRIDALGQLLGERIRFRSIYPIFGGATMPCLFHCYGRQG